MPPEQRPTIENDDARWRTLYRVGAIAPLVTLAVYLAEMVTIIIGDAAGETYPETTSDWFSFLGQHNRIIGLLYLNAFDVFSIAILGIMFLALYVALRRASESCMAIASLFSFLGIAAFVAVRADMGLTMLSLSDRYAAATTGAEMDRLLAAGEAIITPIAATPETVGFFLVAVAGLIISVVMLRSGPFGTAIASVGIVAAVATFANRVTLYVAPSIADAIMPLSGLLWMVWWLLVSRGLFRLARSAPRPEGVD